MGWTVVACDPILNIPEEYAPDERTKWENIAHYSNIGGVKIAKPPQSLINVKVNMGKNKVNVHENICNVELEIVV